MRLHELSPADGSTKKPKRVGRGPGSGHGKTACKGHKGQKARSGGAKGPGFEGGQMPLQRRLPKRGFKNYPFSKSFSIVNLGQIDIHSDLIEVTPETLMESGLVSKMLSGVKILGNGEITRVVHIKAHAVSKSVEEKVKAAGGTVEVIGRGK
jgi:large subunit ribosomal protein L15